MNYVDLKATIQSYAEDFGDNFNAYLDTFIRLAEQRIYQTCQLPAARKNSSGTMTASNKYLSMPLDYLAVHELAVQLPTGEQKYLLNKDVSFIREAYSTGTVTGTPTHYAVFDNNTLLLGPTPDQNYVIELHYFGYPASIVDAGTSWLGDNFNSVLLHGALLEAAIFNKAEEDMMKAYKDNYDSSLALLKQLTEGRNTQDDYRSGHVRFGVR